MNDRDHAYLKELRERQKKGRKNKKRKQSSPVVEDARAKGGVQGATGGWLDFGSAGPGAGGGVDENSREYQEDLLQDLRKTESHFKPF